MSLQSVQQFFAEHAPDIEVIEAAESTATVDMAARVHQVEPGQIAKTLSLKVKQEIILVVMSGNARLDNKKLRTTLGAKARMLSVDEVINATGHPVGGVCPFGLENPLTVYCDVSLQAFSEVLPAAGSTHSCVRITPQRMAELTEARWVDVSQ
ncbi:MULTISPECIES: YbaK/EbsC family protein [Tatumella]|nr:MULTISPECIES: YbaK/EbsC family protein [Tatumella]